MKIGIDISQIIYGTGVSEYTKQLVINLYKVDKDDQFITFGGTLRRKNELRQYTQNILPLSPTLADFVWNKLHILEVERFIGKIDVLHSSDWTQPPTKAFKVTTVHDLAPVKFKEETHKKIVEVHARRLYWVMREVDRVIVPTNAVKDDLMELGIRENKIKVIYEGVSDVFAKQNEENIAETKRKLNIRDEYILAVGVGKRKNTNRIIEAYQKSKKNFKLVIVGGPSGKVAGYPEERGVIHTGYVSEKDLVALYSGAKALVYPSFYEGFGLPILQAMACECPVVTSNMGAMKEVSGEAAILVDHLDINSIAEGIEKAIGSPKTFAKLGLKRVKDFSWEKCAKETLEVYRQSLVK